MGVKMEDITVIAATIVLSILSTAAILERMYAGALLRRDYQDRTLKTDKPASKKFLAPIQLERLC